MEQRASQTLSMPYLQSHSPARSMAEGMGSTGDDRGNDVFIVRIILLPPSTPLPHFFFFSPSTEFTQNPSVVFEPRAPGLAVSVSPPRKTKLKQKLFCFRPSCELAQPRAMKNTLLFYIAPGRAGLQGLSLSVYSCHPQRHSAPKAP